MLEAVNVGGACIDSIAKERWKRNKWKMTRRRLFCEYFLVGKRWRGRGCWHRIE